MTNHQFEDANELLAHVLGNVEEDLNDMLHLAFRYHPEGENEPSIGLAQIVYEAGNVHCWQTQQLIEATEAQTAAISQGLEKIARAITTASGTGYESL